MTPTTSQKTFVLSAEKSVKRRLQFPSEETDGQRPSPKRPRTDWMAEFLSQRQFSQPRFVRVPGGWARREAVERAIIRQSLQDREVRAWMAQREMVLEELCHACEDLPLLERGPCCENKVTFYAVLPDVPNATGPRLGRWTRI